MHREIKAGIANEYICHTLASVNFLKTNPKHFILFEFDGFNNIISMVSEYKKVIADKNETYTKFETIYQVKIDDIKLRELLLFCSLYVCKTTSDIVSLLKDQPNTEIFFKTFLELDCMNMVSILSFDSQCIK